MTEPERRAAGRRHMRCCRRGHEWKARQANFGPEIRDTLDMIRSFLRSGNRVARCGRNTPHATPHPAILADAGRDGGAGHSIGVAGRSAVFRRRRLGPALLRKAPRCSCLAVACREQGVSESIWAAGLLFNADGVAVTVSRDRTAGMLSWPSRLPRSPRQSPLRCSARSGQGDASSTVFAAPLMESSGARSSWPRLPTVPMVGSDRTGPVFSHLSWADRYFHDVEVVVVPVLDGGCDMPEESERQLVLKVCLERFARQHGQVLFEVSFAA